MLVGGLAFSPSLERDYLGGCSDECGRLPLLSRISMSTKSSNFHLLPKDYSGSPTASLYTPWTEAEVLSDLTAGWGDGAITGLKLEYLYGPEPEVSGE